MTENLRSLRLQGFALMIAAAASFCASAIAAAQDSVAEFYRGKTIHFVVGAAAGGGYDVAARTLALHMSRHIPGNPSMVVENMPGASGLVMANSFYNKASRDGLSLGMFSNNLPFEPKLATLGRNAQFDLSRMFWIGSPVQDPLLLWVLTSKARTFEDVRKSKVLIGATVAGGDTYVLPLILREALGAQFEMITGYKGQSEIYLAAERGEVHGMTGGVSVLYGTNANWVREGKAVGLVQFGLDRTEQAKDVPTAIELSTSAADKALFRFIALKFRMARPIALPPETPADRVKALRAAFDATMKDAQFQQDAARAGLEPNPVDGDGIAELTREIETTPDEVSGRLKQILAKVGN